MKYRSKRRRGRSRSRRRGRRPMSTKKYVSQARGGTRM